MDSAGEYDDWLEIFNTTSEEISLTGMYLTDNPDNLTKWKIPSEAGSLAEGDFILIWCDENGSQEGLHANFKISTNGEFLALVATDGVSVIDSLTFGPQSADISYGRNPDGADTWQLFETPTPGYSNLTTGISDNQTSPDSYKLYQNYPNPFNPRTVIGWQLAVSSDVELNIYNTLGEKVVTLVSERQRAGYHSVQWDALGFANGVYLYRLSAKSRAHSVVITRKLVLLK